MYSIVKNKYVANINGEEIYSFQIIESGLEEREVLAIRKKIVKYKLKMKKYIEDGTDFNGMDQSIYDFMEKYDGCYVIPMTPIDTFKI